MRGANGALVGRKEATLCPNPFPSCESILYFCILSFQIGRPSSFLKCLLKCLNYCSMFMWIDVEQCNNHFNIIFLLLEWLCDLYYVNVKMECLVNKLISTIHLHLFLPSWHPPLRRASRLREEQGEFLWRCPRRRATLGQSVNTLRSDEATNNLMAWLQAFLQSWASIAITRLR